MKLRNIRRAILAGIGVAALAGALCTPATASAATASVSAGPCTLTGIYNYAGNGVEELSSSGVGNVTLSAAGSDPFYNCYQTTSGGHTYYEYVDGDTGNCLQATVGDTYMAEGGCAQNSRQFWFWNSHVLENLYFGTKAYTDGTSVKLGSGSGTLYDWSLIE